MCGGGGSFDAGTVAREKSQLVFSSFLVDRYPFYPSRVAAHAHCLAAPKHCRHFDFDPSNEPHSISEVLHPVPPCSNTLCHAAVVSSCLESGLWNPLFAFQLQGGMLLSAGAKGL